MDKIQRLISWYDKITEKLQGEKNIDTISLERLKLIFSPPPNDPFMIYIYPITEKHAQQLKEIINLEFLFDKYDYQLECFKADE